MTCDLATIASGDNATVEIAVRPQSDGSITNTASLAADTFDPNAANNSAGAETTVTFAADLALTKSDSPDPVALGQPLHYTLAVNNAGPSTATAVQLTDTLPPGVAFDSATPSQGTCSETSGTVNVRARHDWFRSGRDRPDHRPAAELGLAAEHRECVL